MNDAEYRRVFRHNVREDLKMLASPAAQLKFQRDVPFVYIPIELACSWFDGHYFPGEPDFVALFSDEEWKFLAEFSAIFDGVTKELEQGDWPEIEGLLQRPDWQRVIAAAKIALAVFEKS